MSETKEIVNKEEQKVAVINKTLQNVKDNSWLGHLADNTSEIDFIMQELKTMLNSEMEDKDKINVLKQLQALDAEKAKRAIHLDMMLLKFTEIDAFSSSDNKEGKDLWTS